MSKEAVIIQEFNEKERKYEYFVKDFDVTESVKILLKRHKEEYDKEKNIFAGTQGFIEAQQLYEKRIADLEAKLAESEKDRLMWQEMYKSADKQNKEICETDIYPLQEQVQQLKQQLAEKEKEIEKWKTKWCDSEKNSLRLYEQNQNKNQDKISFAVEQLEKVKETFTWGKDNGYLTPKNAVNIIDQQIKKLKEGK